MLVASFRNTHQNLPVAARMLAWYQAKPGCHMSPVLELGAVADSSNNGGGRFGADPFDLGDPLTDRAGFEHGLDLLSKRSIRRSRSQSKSHSSPIASLAIVVSSLAWLANISGIMRRAQLMDLANAMPRSSSKPRI